MYCFTSVFSSRTLSWFIGLLTYFIFFVNKTNILVFLKPNKKILEKKILRKIGPNILDEKNPRKKFLEIGGLIF